MITCTHCLGDGYVDTSAPDSHRAEMDGCEHCRGTGAEPCRIFGCRGEAVCIVDGDYLCEECQDKYADDDAAEGQAS